MCTAVTVQSGQMQNFLGRTMDFSYPLEPEIFVMPRNDGWGSLLGKKTFRSRYRFLAIGQEQDGILGFFDGVNEAGFAAAALYFSGDAHYDASPEESGKMPVASLDFLHFLLGACSSVEGLKKILPLLTIVGVPDPVTGSAAPLHWIAADKRGACAVVEPTEYGLRLFDNPIGVLANSPGFEWHMTNLRNYMGASPVQTGEAAWGGVKLLPFGQAGGTSLLPGGYTSPERFVRTAFQRAKALRPENGEEAVTACFHLLDGVTIPKGVVVTDRGTYDYTQYTSFCNMDTGEYFFRAYNGSVIETVGLRELSAGFTVPVCLGALTAHPVFLKRPG